MVAIALIILGVFFRIIPHIPNFAPITATALFGGTYLKKRYALIIPLLTMVISDYLLFPKAMFHSTTLFVWGSFVISGLIGLWIRKRSKPGWLLIAGIIASLQFFLITNFGVWATTNMYPHTFAGLLQSYLMGIPFYRYTLLGDLFYTFSFFGSYKLISWILRKIKPVFLV